MYIELDIYICLLRGSLFCYEDDINVPVLYEDEDDFYTIYQIRQIIYN